MKKKFSSLLCFLIGTIAIAPVALSAAETPKVTAANYVRAETDYELKTYVESMDNFGKFVHSRKPYDVNNQVRYVFVIFRTFVNANDSADIKVANALQDKIKVQQSKTGSFEIPDWDEKSLHTVRDAVNILAGTKADTSGYFGEKDKLNPIDHLLGTAYGWGGNPKEAAMYVNVVPEKNDGKTAYTLTVKDAPVDGFWSVTVYIVRLYQPRKELLDGSWVFPAPVAK